MARKLTPLRKKQIPSPTILIKRPAIDGPTSRAPLNMTEFKAIAFPKSSLFSTRSITKDCRTGISRAFTRPRKTLKTTRCQTAIWPVNVSNASKKAWNMASICVRISSFLRSHLSAKTPAADVRTNVGIWPAKPIKPRRKAEFVRR